MKRIKYVQNDILFAAVIYNIYAEKIIVFIHKPNEYRNEFIAYITINKGLINDTKQIYQGLSLQNAKRKVRKILKEEFEVNLGEEVRSVLCI